MCVFSISWHFTTYVTTSESRSQYSLRHSLFPTPHLLITLPRLGGRWKPSWVLWQFMTKVFTPSPILFGFKGKLKGTGARCKTTRKVMTQATDCINSARKSCEVSFRCLFLQELIRNGGRAVCMIGIIYPISTIIIAKGCHPVKKKCFLSGIARITSPPPTTQPPLPPIRASCTTFWTSKTTF